MASYDKKGWKRQVKAAILGNLASEFTTGLLKAPFEEPRQRFLIQDQEGQELYRQYKSYSANLADSVALRDIIDKSGSDSELWHQDQTWDRMLNEIRQQHGENYLENPYVQAGLSKMREEANKLGKIESDQFLENERKYALLPDKKTFMANVDRYMPTSKSAPQALFRTIKRWVKRQSYEDYVEEAVNNITSGMGLEFTDEGVKKLRTLALEARKPIDAESVTLAVRELFQHPNLLADKAIKKETFDQEQRIISERMYNQQLYMSGNMDPVRRAAYRRLWAEDGNKKSPLNVDIDNLLSKDFKDAFLPTDVNTTNQMMTLLNSDQRIRTLRNSFRNSHARALTKDWDRRDEPSVGWYQDLEEDADREKVDKSLDNAMEGVYFTARNMVRVELMNGDIHGQVHDRFKNSEMAALLQRELIREKVVKLLSGGMEIIESNSITDKIPGWFDTTDSMKHMTGAINEPVDRTLLQNVIDSINSGTVPTTGKDAFVPRLVYGDDTSREVSDETGVVPPPGEPLIETEETDLIISREGLESLQGHFRTEAEREQKTDELLVKSRASVSAAVKTWDKEGEFDSPDEQWEKVEGAVQVFEDGVGVKIYETIPSKKGSTEKGTHDVKFDLPISPYIYGDINEVFGAEGSDEEFSFFVDKTDGNVDINFQGTSSRKPSGWSLPKLTPDNNINIDDIKNNNVYNHLRRMAEEYDGASKEDRVSIINKIDFGYGEDRTDTEGADDILLWEDTALVEDLLDQFIEKYLRHDFPSQSNRPVITTSLLAAP